MDGKDLSNSKKLTAELGGVSTVVHCAGIGKPLDGLDFSSCRESNGNLTQTLLSHCIKAGVKRFIYISSTSYYGAEEGIPVRYPLSEVSPTLSSIRCKNNFSTESKNIYYSISKVIGEQVVAAYGISGLIQSFVLRVGPIREPGIFAPYSREVPICVDIRNVINAVELCIESKNLGYYNVYNITDSITEVDIKKAINELDYKPIVPSPEI